MSQLRPDCVTSLLRTGTAEESFETIGCGCAFFDYDNDGWLDIFLLSGSRLAGALDEATNRLFKNNRDGTFTDVTKQAGLLKSGWACGVWYGTGYRWL